MAITIITKHIGRAYKESEESNICSGNLYNYPPCGISKNTMKGIPLYSMFICTTSDPEKDTNEIELKQMHINSLKMKSIRPEMKYIKLKTS